jgi:hypothetical protein
MRNFIFLFFFLTWSAANAANIVFYNDFSVNLSSVETLKAELRREHNAYIVDSIAAFENTLLTHPEIDVAILAIQDSVHKADEFPQLRAYAKRGGNVIFMDANRDSSWENEFHFEYTGNNNQNTVWFVDKSLSQLLETETLTLYNPGYHVYSMGMKAVDRTLAVFPNGDAASLYLDGHVIVNGFLLDTDISISAAAERLAWGDRTAAAARATGSSLILGEINYLLDPPHAISVPLSRTGLLLAALMLLCAGTLFLYRRATYKKI